ncbi:MAG: NYN domain-containing protein [Alphaproteobacteria bacterium]|nr:NYN domain-containing protein [Alphaproteobacteria bacterium]
MEIKKQKASLLVDGEVLKRHILSQGEQHSSQTVLKYLYYMVSEIRQKFPNTDIGVDYYGVCAVDDAVMPVSGERYPDVDIKENMRLATLPNSELKTHWSRVYYPFDQAWVMNPTSYNKTKLEDRDFSLNEQPKGLLTQLVDEMAEKAVCHRENRLFVYGDADDMTYALATTNGLGMPISQVLFDGKNPYICEFSQEGNPVVCSKNILEEVSESLRQPWARGETLSRCLGLLRGVMENEDQEALLMMDMGSVRQYLHRRELRMSVQNVEKLVHQIQDFLPEKATQTILYHATIPTENARNSVWVSDERPFEFDLSKGASFPGVRFSLGKTQLDKNFPAILKKEKWFVHPRARLKEDFVSNFRQYDVDDRIAYDMALARINPMINRVYLLSTDGDFVHSVEQARRAGLSVSLLCLEENSQWLSVRLERGVEDVLQIPVDLGKLTSRHEEKAAVRKQNEKEKHERLRRLQQERRNSARMEAEDEEEAYAGFVPKRPSKEERWGQKRVKHKRLAHKIITKSRGTYGK